jgi:thiosulfate dehydrogenase (quinone) large subunit
VLKNKISLMLSGWQQFFIVLLRIGIGWHFLREGWVKFTHPTFTAAPYLLGSWGPLSPLFNKIATLTWANTPVVNWFIEKDPSKAPWINNTWMLHSADISMPWMLLIAGLGLMLGLFTRLSCVLAMVLLLMFYAATPPIDLAPQAPSYSQFSFSADTGAKTDWAAFKSNLDHAQWAMKHNIGNEGNYLIVNKNLVEFLALAALLSLDTGLMCGLDVYLRRIFARKDKEEPESAPTVAAANV